MNENKKLSILLRGIIAENPVLILILGTCPTLATTTSIISGSTITSNGYQKALQQAFEAFKLLTNEGGN